MRSCLALCLSALLATTGGADETSQPPKITVLASGLDRPSAVCVQPSTADLLFFEAGSGRILRQKAPLGGSSEPSAPSPVIDLRPSLGNVQTLAMEFLDREHLITATDARVQFGLQVWKLEDQELVALPAQSLPLSAAAEGIDSPAGLVTTGKAAIVVAATEGNSGGKAVQAELLSEKLGELKPLIPAERAPSSPTVGLGEPLAAALSPRGELVVVHRLKEANQVRLAFFNSSTGSALFDQPLELDFVSAVAYSPKTGRLYLSVLKPATEGGGIYRLDTALRGLKPVVQATRVLELERPTSIVFWPNGTLFATTLGPVSAGESRADGGQLASIEGGF